MYQMSTMKGKQRQVVECAETIHFTYTAEGSGNSV